MLDIISHPLRADQVATLSAEVEAHRNAYAPVKLGDDRHQAVIDYFEDRDTVHDVLEQPAGREKQIGHLYGQLFATHPTFPEEAAALAPWATAHEDTTEADGAPGRFFRRTIITGHGLEVWLEQFWVVSLESGTLRGEPIEMRVLVGENDAIDLTRPEQAADVAQGLSIAAAEWTKLVAPQGE